MLNSLHKRFAVPLAAIAVAVGACWMAGVAVAWMAAFVLGLAVGAALFIGHNGELRSRLKTAEESLSRIAESNLVGFVTGTQDGRLTRSNDLFLRLVGATREELKAGQLRWDEMTSPECLESDLAHIYEVARTGRCEPWEKAFLAKDGRRVPVSVEVVGGVQEMDALVVDLSAVKKTQDDLRQLSLRLLHAQDMERRRIARELHDGPAQSVAAAKMLLARGAEDAAADAERRAEAVQLLDEAFREMRTISFLLHPPMLEDLGLEAGLRAFVHGFASRSGIATVLEIGALPKLAPELASDLFRVVQASLSNVHAHSGSRRAWVRLAQVDDQIRLDITDEGRGIALAGERIGRGVGIAGMRERVAVYRGTLSVRSNAGPGTTVTATFQMEQRTAGTGAARSLRLDEVVPERPADQFAG